MPRTILPVVAILVLVVADRLRAEDATRFASDAAAAEAFFETKVRPVLVAHCAKCHGADKQSSNLRVDSRQAILTGGDRGAALLPGNAEESLLIQAVRHRGDAHDGEQLHMPPGEQLSAAALEDLARWVRIGAPWPASATTQAAFDRAGHWAFQPVTVVEPPVDRFGWALTPIDRFIAAGLAERGLEPTHAAAKNVLLRRAYFDLVGLPPSSDELAEFIADDSPEAFGRVVDRLLASPHYGERWGRHWMDVARYADTAGDNADYPVPELYKYRDYVIAAFNADKPYDEFVREQLAGDILAAAAPDKHYPERVIATGFLALSRRYGTMPGELWHLTLEDTIDTVGQTFLGLTLRCARCHDHKFDPVTTEDYYALYGIFDSTRYAYAGSEEYQSKEMNRTGFVPLVPAAEAAPKIEAHARHVEELRRAVEQAEKNNPATLELLQEQIDALAAQIKDAVVDQPEATRRKQELNDLEQEHEKTKRDLEAALKKLRNDLRDAQRSGLAPDLEGAYATSEGTPHDIPVQRRGDPGDPGKIARRNTPKFLRGGDDLPISTGASGRLELADWLVNRRNPLTARVMINRVWQWHFGKGLVMTPSNFGVRGKAPTHSQLLDWLAHEFVASGWSVKAMHRAIMLSRTYQLASEATGVLLAADPGNQYYGRFDRRRLDAEALRDAVMTVAGTLDLTPPTAHPFPPLNEWHWTQHRPFKTIYPSQKRSVYLMTQRLQRHPYLMLFDGPDTNYSTGVRTEATVPLQSLYFLNNPGFTTQAQAFAARLIAGSSEPAARVKTAILQAFSRPTNDAETLRALGFIDHCRQELAATGCKPEELELATWTHYTRVLLSTNEFLYVD